MTNCYTCNDIGEVSFSDPETGFIYTEKCPNCIVLKDEDYEPVDSLERFNDYYEYEY